MGILPEGGPLKAHRPVLMGRKGVIATAHNLASEAGMAIFRRQQEVGILWHWRLDALTDCWHNWLLHASS